MTLQFKLHNFAPTVETSTVTQGDQYPNTPHSAGWDIYNFCEPNQCFAFYWPM